MGLGFVNREVGKNTILKLGLVLLLIIGGDLGNDLVSVKVLVLKQVSNFALADWLAFLVSVVESRFVETEAVLHIEVLFLRDLGEFLLQVSRCLLFEEVFEVLVAKAILVSLVADVVDKGLLLVVVEAGEKTHELLEPAFVFLLSLVLSARVEVLDADEVGELFAVLVVDTLEKVWVQELFVVELSDLVLVVDWECTAVIVVIFSCQLSVDLQLSLSLLGLWKLASLGKVDGQGKDSFAVTVLHGKFVGNILHLLEVFLHLSGPLVVSPTISVWPLGFVDSTLELDWVHDVSQVLVREVSNVLEPVDLAEVPVHVIQVFAGSLDSEVGLAHALHLFEALLEAVASERLLAKLVEVVVKTVLDGSRGSIGAGILIEKAEPADDVSAGLTSFLRDTLIGKFVDAVWNLSSNVGADTESGGDKWVAHPSLSEENVTLFKFCLNQAPRSVCKDTAAENAPHELNFFDFVHLKHLLSVYAVVTIGDLQLQNLLLPYLILLIGDITDSPVGLEQRVHLYK